jgi:hypothetical protein
LNNLMYKMIKIKEGMFIWLDDSNKEIKKTKK